MKLEVDSLGGQCPVQGYGHLGDHLWYFRARGESWSFAVWAAGIGWLNGYELPHEDPIFTWVEPYHLEDPFGAGYMPEDEARQFIQQAADRFMAT
jgi:hypothetical protein